MVKLRSFYRMLRDPEQKLTRRLGFDAAVQVAIVDSHGVLRYRGAVDDAYDAAEVTKRYLGDALAALVAGKEPAVVETAKVYGCGVQRSGLLRVLPTDWRGEGGVAGAGCEEVRAEEAVAPFDFWGFRPSAPTASFSVRRRRSARAWGGPSGRERPLR